MAAKPPRIAENKTDTADQPVKQVSSSVQDRIRIRAYELYEQRHGAPGDADDDWYRAEAEIKSKSAETSQ